MNEQWRYAGAGQVVQRRRHRFVMEVKIADTDWAERFYSSSAIRDAAALDFLAEGYAVRFRKLVTLARYDGRAAA